MKDMVNKDKRKDTTKQGKLTQGRYELAQYIINNNITNYIEVCEEALSVGIYDDVVKHSEHYMNMCAANCVMESKEVL